MPANERTDEQMAQYLRVPILGCSEPLCIATPNTLSPDFRGTTPALNLKAHELMYRLDLIIAVIWVMAQANFQVVASAESFGQFLGDVSKGVVGDVEILDLIEVVHQRLGERNFTRFVVEQFQPISGE